MCLASVINKYNNRSHSNKLLDVVPTEMSFLRVIRQLSGQLLNVYHEENGQIDWLHSLANVFGTIMS